MDRGLFAVADIEPLDVRRGAAIAGMYLLSPFVWRDGDAYGLLLRVVPYSENPAEKIARVHFGRSPDGLNFWVGDDPVIAPGPGEEDRDGCEDPTLAMLDDTYYVYYTGWNEGRKRGQLLMAAGREIARLQKRGIALRSTYECANPKEATIVRAGDGTWRLFFEYASGDASKIGIAVAANVNGPWSVQTPLFDARPERWDSWHLSTGPVLCGHAQCPIMFYNGANRNAEWRIGWIAFDERYERVVDRCEEPLITPPPWREPEDTDIAFAASAIEERDAILLYYSIADKDMFRATIRRQG